MRTPLTVCLFLVAACSSGGDSGSAGAPSAGMQVTPPGNFLATVQAGGPVPAPMGKAYSLQNLTNDDCPWSASLSETWLFFMGPSSGVLGPGETASVTVEIDTISAPLLGPGKHTATLTFLNPSTQSPFTSRDIVFELNEAWTPLVPSLDTRIIYVSEASGVDTNQYMYHTVGDPEVGPDPFLPKGTVYAYKTLAAACDQLRDGMPDWVLLERGNTWGESFSKWKKSGQTAAAPMLIGAFGVGARPAVGGFDTEWGPGSPDDTFDFLQIVSLEFYDDGITRIIGGDEWLIEDCLLSMADNTGIVIQGDGPAPLTNVTVRRCTIVDRYPTGSKAQGMYVTDVDGLLIEQCLFDHNGWSEVVPGANPTIYSHNCYIQKTCKNVVFRENISANAASHGVQQRPGGVIDNNLFLRNPISLLVGHSSISNSEWPSTYAGTGLVRNNVVLDSRDIDPTTRRGVGLWAQQTSDLEIYGNIFAHQTQGTGVCAAMWFDMNNQNVRVGQNIVYDWPDPVSPGEGFGLRIRDNIVGYNVFSGNHFQQVTGGLVVSHFPSFAGCLYGTNVYHSGNTSSDWFDPGGSKENWEAKSGEFGAQYRAIAYPEPTRSVETYMSDVLGLTPTVDAFLVEVRKQNKLNWRREFTAQAVNSYIRQGFAATFLY